MNAAAPTTLRKWYCRKPGCKRVLMEHCVTKGTIIKLCEKCGWTNVLVDGIPQE